MNHRELTTIVMYRALTDIRNPLLRTINSAPKVNKHATHIPCSLIPTAIPTIDLFVIVFPQLIPTFLSFLPFPLHYNIYMVTTTTDSIQPLHFPFHKHLPMNFN